MLERRSPQNVLITCDILKRRSDSPPPLASATAANLQPFGINNSSIRFIENPAAARPPRTTTGRVTRVYSSDISRSRFSSVSSAHAVPSADTSSRGG